MWFQSNYQLKTWHALQWALKKNLRTVKDKRRNGRPKKKKTVYSSIWKLRPWVIGKIQHVSSWSICCSLTADQKWPQWKITCQDAILKEGKWGKKAEVCQITELCWTPVETGLMEWWNKFEISTILKERGIISHFFLQNKVWLKLLHSVVQVYMHCAKVYFPFSCY